MNGDKSYDEATKRIIITEILIINEVSMIDSKVLSQIEFVCRCLRGKNTIFGGLQAILCGDLYQLSSVSNVLYSDYGQYYFEVE